MAQMDPLEAVHNAIAVHPSLGRDAAIRIDFADGVVMLDGTVPDIAARRLVPRVAAEASGRYGVRDRLRLRSAEPRDDAAIAADVEQALASEPLLAGYAIARTGPGDRDDSAGVLKVGVTNDVIRLEGQVESLLHRRIAEVLAWWTPGCADVDNRLHVEPPEQDSDAAITEAVRLVLDRDPRFDATQVAVRTHDRSVMLIGILPEPEQRMAAEEDAWYIAGVHDVDNRIRVFDRLELDRYADEASRESFPASDPPSRTPIVGVGGTARQERKNL